MMVTSEVQDRSAPSTRFAGFFQRLLALLQSTHTKVDWQGVYPFSAFFTSLMKRRSVP